jgi:hypothetical protein
MTVTPNRRGRIVMLCAATAVFVGTFLFRFLTLEFMNDHVVHLSRGRQILLGEVPVRDFFDPGEWRPRRRSAAIACNLVYVDRDLSPSGDYEPLGLPCDR